MEVLASQQDQSVNFVEPAERGMIEARFVRRQDDYFIVYLSSQTACNKGCKMCHLTQTRQMSGVDVDLEGLVRQAETVLAHYDSEAPAQVVHFNFMARGEAFANQHILASADDLLDRLEELALARNLIPVFKFSTIMPREVEELEFTDIFRRHRPDLYYSLYSVDENFRARWLPKAIPATVALAKLVRWQEVTRKIPVLHWAFIEGENDSAEDIWTIVDVIRKIGLRADFNIVRYNPFSPDTGKEPDDDVVLLRAGQLRAGLPYSKVQVVPRVGFDVKASCGMFIAART